MDTIRKHILFISISTFQLNWTTSFRENISILFYSIVEPQDHLRPADSWFLCQVCNYIMEQLGWKVKLNTFHDHSSSSHFQITGPGSEWMEADHVSKTTESVGSVEGCQGIS